MSDMTLKMTILGNSSSLQRELQNSGSAVKRFGDGAKRQFDGLKNALGSVQGQLAALGVSFGAIQQLAASARLDKGLVQMGQTAGATRQQIAAVRQDLFDMARVSGEGVDDLKGGLDVLVQSGLNLKEAKATLEGVNVAMAVTGARAESLAPALTVAATAFNFDLSKPGQALTMLDKMTVAGRLGNAELENLSSLFPRIAGNAQQAGMGFEQTLGFVEALSQVERTPERLGTLADSTVRLFTTGQYMKQAMKAMHNKNLFFDKNGARRDAIAVLGDIKHAYDRMGTDLARQKFIEKLAGKDDRDTIRGLTMLLTGDMLQNVGKFSDQIKGAGGQLKRDLPEATANMVTQAGRLKSVLRAAADDFARPINDVLGHWTKKLLDSKKDGGLGLTGNQLLGGAGALALTGLLLKDFGPKVVKRIFGSSIANTAAGTVEGKVLEKYAGVTPVFVVNMPSGGVGGSDALDAAADAAVGAGGAKTVGKTLPKMGKVLPWITGAATGLGGLTLLITSAEILFSGAAINYGAGALLDSLHGTHDGTVLNGLSRIHEEMGKEQRASAERMNIINDDAKRAAIAQERFDDLRDLMRAASHAGGEPQVNLTVNIDPLSGHYTSFSEGMKRHNYAVNRGRSILGR